jgi:non-ribosomal peptide synthetase component F
MLLYAAWSVLLSRLSGQTDVVVGVPVANRRQAEVEGLIGFFVNTLALRVSVDLGSSVAQLLEQVRELTLAGVAYQDVPFEQVVEDLNPPRSLAHGPLFQTLLVLQNAPTSSIELPGLRLLGQDVEAGAAKVDLTLLLQENGERLCGALNYASDLFDASTIQRWIGHLEVLLDAIADDPQRPVAELPLLAPAERQALLQEFGAPRASFAEPTLIHARFQAQAALTPDAIAVEYEGDTLSYAQLNARANRLAHRLRAEGVGPDRLVGL